MRIRELAMTRPRFGYLRIHVLLRREDWPINHKRVHCPYCLEGLQVRMRVPRHKRSSLHRGPVPQPTAANQHWSMDIVHDQLLDGLRFRVPTVIDQWSRERLPVEPGSALTGAIVGSVGPEVELQSEAPHGIGGRADPSRTFHSLPRGISRRTR